MMCERLRGRTRAITEILIFFWLKSVVRGRDRSKRFYPEVLCVAESEPKRILAQVLNPGTLVRDSTLGDEVL